MADKELPHLDDVLEKYYLKTVENTFPSTDFTTSFVAFTHIIGVHFLYFGWLLPPKYMWIYLAFTSILLFSYAIFDRDCFMTLLANMNTDFDGTALMVSKEVATNFIIIALVISIVIIRYPQLAPFNLLKKVILSLD